jgi:predicted DsbA family dithiol-disulfide isomerase
MAMQSDNVTMASIGAAEFPDAVHRYRITGVPKTVINDNVEILGAQPENMFVPEALKAFV